MGPSNYVITRFHNRVIKIVINDFFNFISSIDISIMKVKGRITEQRKFHLKNLVRKMKNRNSKNDFITANANN